MSEANDGRHSILLMPSQALHQTKSEKNMYRKIIGGIRQGMDVNGVSSYISTN